MWRVNTATMAIGLHIGMQQQQTLVACNGFLLSIIEYFFFCSRAEDGRAAGTGGERQPGETTVRRTKTKR